MSNLGLYQWFTITAKKVGGPVKLLGMFIGGGCNRRWGSGKCYYQ